MRGHNVNIYFSEETYNRIKPLIKQRKVSQFVNQAVEKELDKEKKKEKEQLREGLAIAFKRMNKNKNLQKELATLEKATMKDISRKLTKNE